MYAKLQRIPRCGEFIFYKRYRFTLVDVDGRRIGKVEAEKMKEEASYTGVVTLVTNGGRHPIMLRIIEVGVQSVQINV